MKTKHEIIKFNEGGIETYDFVFSEINLARMTVKIVNKDKILICPKINFARPMRTVMIRNRHALVSEMES